MALGTPLSGASSAAGSVRANMRHMAPYPFFVIRSRLERVLSGTRLTPSADNTGPSYTDAYGARRAVKRGGSRACRACSVSSNSC
jgi:hypothetical protein